MTVPLITNSGTVLGPAATFANQGFQALSVAQSLAGQLAGGISGSLGVTITPVFPSGPDAPAAVTSTPPTFAEVAWTIPTTPAGFLGELDVSDLFFPDFTAEAPGLIFPEAPDFAVPDVGDAPSVDTSYEMPDLTVTLPDAPDLLTISIAPFDGVTLPTFSETAPTLTLVAPNAREYTPGADYTSALLTALQTSLEERITTGGTGLGAAAEQGIWERNVEREARGAGQAIAQLEQMEDLGYAMPPGIYVEARTRIITEMDYASRGHSREVMVESARLELENVKHALTTTVALESRLIDYTNATEQRLFESCRYITEAGVSIYNAGVQAFQARVEAYRAAAQVYEARIRGALGEVEVYKAQIDAEQAKAQVNRALVDSYQAQIAAALSNVEVFKARIGAIQTVSELERNKILVYGEQVKAYSTRVSAFSGQVEAFRARIGAETAKQQAYSTSADAFGRRVDAISKQIDARIAAYKGRIDSYVAQWEGYKAQTQGEAAKAEAVSSYNRSLAAIYESEVRGDASYNEVLTKQWQAVLDQNARVAEIGVAAGKANADLAVSVRSIAMDGAKAAAQVTAQIGAAALSTVHYSGSYNESRSDSGANSESLSRNESTSTSVSNSTSTSTNTNYNYSV